MVPWMMAIPVEVETGDGMETQVEGGMARTY